MSLIAQTLEEVSELPTMQEIDVYSPWVTWLNSDNYLSYVKQWGISNVHIQVIS